MEVKNHINNTLATAKRCRGRLIEVQHKLDRNGSKHDFIDSV